MARRRGSFWIKLALIATAVAVADVMFWRADELGANVGLMGLTWVAALALANPALRRHALARQALIAGAVLALLQIERPTFVGALLYVVAMGVAALAPRAPRGEDAWRWCQRLMAGAAVAVAGPVLDLVRLQKAQRRKPSVRIGGALATVALPLAGGAVFLTLFAAANPVISGMLGGWRLVSPDVGRLAFWTALAFPLWVVLRPRGLQHTWAPPALGPDFGGSFAGPTAIAASLAVFNLIFGVQNGLDVAYLWSGAGLPQGVSFADYAHRGAYPLIATALLAGLFVLVFLRPGSATASSRAVRILVSAWVAQNLFLVASTALRTVDYVEAYSLTNLRIAALLWMGLVAVGLILILWRLLRAKSSSWLLNANVAAVALVLAVCAVVDLSAVTSAWNIRHAREADGRGVALDLCYMRGLRGAAVVSLAELERQPVPDELRRRAARVRQDITAELWRNSQSWRSWNWRDARRLQRLEAMGVDTKAPPAPPHGCDGAVIPQTAPAAPAATAPTPSTLTPAPNPRT